jgi:hypothetical protein
MGMDEEEGSALDIFEHYHNGKQLELDVLVTSGQHELCGSMAKTKGKVLELAPVLHIIEFFLEVRLGGWGGRRTCSHGQA